VYKIFLQQPVTVYLKMIKIKNNKKNIQKLSTFFYVFHFMIISLKSFRNVEEKLLHSTA